MFKCWYVYQLNASKIHPGLTGYACLMGEHFLHWLLVVQFREVSGMSSGLSKSARKVQTYLESRAMIFDVIELSESTRTAKEAATAIGCEVAHIAKSLIFMDQSTEQLVLVVASGVNQVDLKKIEVATAKRLAPSDAKTIKKVTGFSIGGVPPVGHKQPLDTIIDEDLLQYPKIWAAAGTPHAVFSLTPDQLKTLTQGKIMGLSCE